jgi:hypothetical protein
MRINERTISILVSGFLFSVTAFAETSAVMLGSSAAEVKSAFGQPMQDLGMVVKYETCEGSESDAKWAFVFLQALPDASEAEKVSGGKLTGIQRYACGSEKLNEAAVREEAASLLPADAVAIAEFTTADGRKAWEFQSSLLASRFSASDFLACDNEGNVLPVAPGTLSYAFYSDGSSWFMGLGTCL